MPSYSNSQRLGFAGLVIGFILCVIGAIPPHWQKAELNANQFLSVIGESLPLIGNLDILKFNGGLWYFCLDSDIPGLSDKNECYTYEEEDQEHGTLWVCRITCLASGVLSMLCALTGLCRQCCCDGGKTVCHGIMSFLAGVSGIICVAVFASTTRDGLAYKLQAVSFDWAFYIYAAGVAIITLVSFVLCFTSPNMDFRGMVFQRGSGVPYTNMSETHVQVNSQPIVYPVAAPGYPPVVAQGGYDASRP